MCARPPQARVGRGLSLTYCRYHVQKCNRHGCYFKGTYSAAQLRPYRSAAESYLKANLADFWVAAALTSIRAILDNAGPNERIVDVHRGKPPFKARAAFARMRRNGVPPMRLLINTVAVAGAYREDPVKSGSFPDPQNYLLVQTGKIALRTSSGAHYDYLPKHMRDQYQRSSGQALRLIGEALNGAAEHVIAEHLGAILAAKAERFAPAEATNQ